MSEFPIKKKTHRAKPRNYYNRKKRVDNTHEPSVYPPTDRLCAEERRGARKQHQPEKKTARLGRFEGKIGKVKHGVIQVSFQAFSMGRKSSRRKSRRRKRRSPRITAAGSPDRTRVFGILDTEKVRRRKRGLVPVHGVVNPRKCRVKEKT